MENTMINISIEGGTRREHNLVHDAFNFAMKYLMPRKQNLEVEFEVASIPDDADAYHMCVEKGRHEIEIQQGLGDADIVTAVFHEMVHVRQHERGQLKDYGIRKSWKGEEYLSIYDTVETYKNLPWEEEAYRLQEEMYSKWIQT
jgi:hypothetical protein